jgi:uncharacterized protein (DUF111 family)
LTHVHFQPIGGAAGDMTLASLVAAGAPLQEITPLLRDLGVAFDIATERVEVSGIGALRATVNHPEQRAHRTFKDIRDLVEGAGLPDRARSRAVEVLPAPGGG